MTTPHNAILQSIEHSTACLVKATDRIDTQESLEASNNDAAAIDICKELNELFLCLVNYSQTGPVGSTQFQEPAITECSTSVVTILHDRLASARSA